MRKLLTARLFFKGTDVPIDIELGPGEQGTVVAPSGSGKTTAALQIAGVRDVREGSAVKSSISGPSADQTAFVPSDASVIFSLLGSTLREEIALTSAFLGRKPDMEGIEAVLAWMRIAHLADRDPLTLSGGESVRAALAICVIKRPSLLILDDVWDAVDREGRPELMDRLSEWRSRTGAAIVEFRREPPDHGHIWVVECDNPRPANSGGIRLPTCDGSVQVEALHSAYRTPRFVFGPLSETLHSEELVALQGANGSGKTTCLKTLAGIIKPEGGVVSFGTQTLRPSTRLSSRARYAHYVFQNPDHQLYLPKIGAEITAAARYGGVDPGNWTTVAEALGIGDRTDMNPLDQPRSVRRLITLASALVSGAPLLLLDEPSAALDETQKTWAASAIRAHCARGGTAIVVSHDEEFMARLPCTTWHVEAGQVRAMQVA